MPQALGLTIDACYPPANLSFTRDETDTLDMRLEAGDWCGCTSRAQMTLSTPLELLERPLADKPQDLSVEPFGLLKEQPVSALKL